MTGLRALVLLAHLLRREPVVDPWQADPRKPSQADGAFLDLPLQNPFPVADVQLVDPGIRLRRDAHTRIRERAMRARLDILNNLGDASR